VSARRATVTAELEAPLTPAQLDHVTPGLSEADDGAAYDDRSAAKTTTLTAKLPVRECHDRLRFKGCPLRIGEDVALDFGTGRVTATVRNIERERGLRPSRSSADGATEPTAESTPK